MTRTYTADEVDRMRRLVRFQWLYGMKESERIPGNPPLSWVFQPNEYAVAVEEQLRTYIAASVDPKELE